MKVGGQFPSQENDGEAETVVRRDLLKFAAIGSAGLTAALPTIARGSTTTRPPTAPVQTLAELPSNAISPKGWLQLYLQKQADNLGTNLPRTSWPFTGRFWQGQEEDGRGTNWSLWEQKGYWIDGALRLSILLKDQDLYRSAAASVEYTLSHAGADGYLGPKFLLNNAGRNIYRWPHTVFFRAVMAYADLGKGPEVAQALRRHFLSDRHRTDYSQSRDITNIEIMLWAYGKTGDRELLGLAERAWAAFQQSWPVGDRLAGDLSPAAVHDNSPVHAHGVTYAEVSKLPALLYLHTGKREYLEFAKAAQDRVLNHHLLVDGCPSSSEDYAGTSPLDAHETCDITDHTWTWGYLLMATRDGTWADRIERACFNAGMGAIKKDWRGLQYFSSPNQVIATHDSSHVPFVANSVGWMAFRPNPGHTVACCAGNVHRLFPNYVMRMWMRRADGGLAATLYGASSLKTTVGKNATPVTILQETNYPFSDTIDLTISLANPTAFTLALRIPGWCTGAELKVNGATIAVRDLSHGFVEIERLFRSGDHISLRLPMQNRMRYWSSGAQWDRPGISVERGPLLYALEVKEDWAPEVDPDYSTEAYPEWNAQPLSDWNFSIAVKETELLKSLKFSERAIPADPWLNPPFRLSVPMKRVDTWKMGSSDMYGRRKVTPGLPQISDDEFKVLTQADVEWIDLVPYGATHLRISIFPQLFSDRP